MASYRLYFFGPSGHIIDAHEFYSDDDDQAGRVAAEHVEGRPAELWSGARMVRPYAAQTSDGEHPLTAA